MWQLYNIDSIWVAVKGYEGLYLISNQGQIKSLRKNRIIKEGISRGYSQVSLTKEVGVSKTISVHKLVAIHFIQNPEGHKFINHKDGNKQNNCVSNLEWCTSSYNQKHAYENGLRKRMAGKLNGNYRTGKYCLNVAV